MFRRFQDHACLELTARDAIAAGDVDRPLTNDDLTDALSRAAATDVLGVLPDGLDTQLGTQWPGGVGLSGEQWQRLATTRAMVRSEPLLLVLDEPTSALDPATEHALFDRYAQAVRETTPAVASPCSSPPLLHPPNGAPRHRRRRRTRRRARHPRAIHRSRWPLRGALRATSRGLPLIPRPRPGAGVADCMSASLAGDHRLAFVVVFLRVAWLRGVAKFDVAAPTRVRGRLATAVVRLARRKGASVHYPRRPRRDWLSPTRSTSLGPQLSWGSARAAACISASPGHRRRRRGGGNDIPQLEEAGVVERIVADRGVAYRLTEYGRALGPIVNALGLWGARGLAEPRFGRQRHDPEVPTGDSLAAALIASRTEAVVTPFTVKVSAGPAAAHATVAEHGVEAAPGPDPDRDLRLGGAGVADSRGGHGRRRGAYLWCDHR